MSEKNPVGRPSAFTDEVLSKLCDAFSIGATNKEACSHAGISEAPFYRYIAENPEFKERVEALKDEMPLKAKWHLQKFLTDGDKQTVQWYLERKKRDEFSLKTEVDHTSGGQAITELKITMV